jgi:hypothetical protein
MISRITAVLVLVFATASNAWAPATRKEFLQKAISFGAAVTIATSAANAVDFTGSYTDPFHPNCQRVITMDGSSAKLVGTDGTPACPTDGSGAAWSLEGLVQGDEILVDFTPKGGPKDLKGVWDGSGIKWPDGNKWSIKN